MKESANPFLRDFQRKRPRMNGLAGSLPFIRSNLCTRHILNKITPRGHEDWPDKRRSVDTRCRIGRNPGSLAPFRLLASQAPSRLRGAQVEFRASMFGQHAPLPRKLKG